MKYVIDSHTGLALHAERIGHGEPILLIQGMSGHAGMWGEAFLEALAKEREVITYDHRGIGASSRADSAFSVADLADDAAALLEALGQESVHVMGISMGGMVAQELALRHPGRVRSLVLGCTTAGGPDAFGGPGAGRMLDAMATGDAETVTRVAFEVNVSAGFASRPGELDRFAATSLSRRVPPPVVKLQAAACLSHDAMSRVGILSMPTMMIHGEEDQMILSSEGVKLASLIPDSSCERWQGVGHLFWWEQPDQTAARVLSHTGS